MIARTTALAGEHAANDPIVDTRRHRAVVIEPLGADEPVLEPETEEERLDRIYGAMPTARRFPRTRHGSQGAFTRDVDYAAPIEAPMPLPRGFWFIVGVAIAAALFGLWYSL